MDNLPSFMTEIWFIVLLICLCVILLISLVAVCVVCLRQRHSISELEQQLVEVEKHVESTEQKVPIEGTETITIKESSPASQVWESDECVFYDLGSVSRGVSREVLDQIETADEPPLVSENSNDSKENSSNQEHETNTLGGDETPVTDEKDLGIDEKGSIKSLQEDSKVDSGSLDELTDEIWVGDVSKESNEKLSINDALSDISENGGMEDSGNETISNDDMLCPNVDVDERGEDGSKLEEEVVKGKEHITAVNDGENEENNVDENKD